MVPKGYVRLLGKLAEITDSGIPVHFVDHDMWMMIISKELNIPSILNRRNLHSTIKISYRTWRWPGDTAIMDIKC